MHLHPLLIPIVLGAMTFVVLAGIIFSVYKTRALSNRIAQNSQAIQNNSVRSCKAIHGAAAFWKIVRNTTEELLQDPSLTPKERSSNRHYVIALTHVINLADALPCDGVK